MENQIDLKYLRQLLGGDEEMVARFLELFKVEIPRQMATLEAQLNTGDFAAANVTAHAIKGQWQMVGREDLAGIARGIEGKTERGNNADAEFLALKYKSQTLI